MELGGQFTFGWWISTWSASVQAFRGTVALASRGFGTRITISKFSVVGTEGRDRRYKERLDQLVNTIFTTE